MLHGKETELKACLKDCYFTPIMTPLNSDDGGKEVLRDDPSEICKSLDFSAETMLNVSGINNPFLNVFSTLREREMKLQLFNLIFTIAL